MKNKKKTIYTEAQKQLYIKESSTTSVRDVSAKYDVPVPTLYGFIKKARANRKAPQKSRSFFTAPATVVETTPKISAGVFELHLEIKKLSEQLRDSQAQAEKLNRENKGLKELVRVYI